MRLLLDTNIVFPLGNGAHSDLPPSVSRLLADNHAQLCASVASLWEIAIKFRLGKLELDVALDALPDIWAALGITLLPISAAHAIAEALPVPDTRDPFDRLLLAICAVSDMRLVTADRKLVDHRLAYPGTTPPQP